MALVKPNGKNELRMELRGLRAAIVKSGKVSGKTLAAFDHELKRLEHGRQTAHTVTQKP